MLYIIKRALNIFFVPILIVINFGLVDIFDYLVIFLGYFLISSIKIVLKQNN